jgi:hypothetical protein
MPVWPQIFITGPRHVPLCRLLQLLEDCNLCAIHAKRVTISEWPPLACLPACQLEFRCCSDGMECRHLCGIHSCAWHCCLPADPPAVPKDMQLARRIRGPVYGVCSY